MPESFNLVDEPWLLARTTDGRTEELSLRGVFARAGQLTEILGEIPTQGFALLRLVLAVLARAVDGPEDELEWRDLWAADSPPMDRVDAYLERVRDRFDLFHPTHPFFQVADLRTAKGEVSGLEKLLADVPTGHPYFTTRSGSGLARLTPAEAARWLVHLQAFDVSGIKSGAVGDPRVKGGRGYPIGTGWTGNLGGLAVQGDTLWRTLLLNTVPLERVELVAPHRRDRPAWEAPPAGPAEAADLAERPYGPLDLYTWQSRRVRLHGGRDGVTGVVVTNGDSLSAQNRWRVEPMTAWRRSQNQERSLGLALVYMPRRHDPSRALWRGLANLLPLEAPRGKADGGEPSVTAAVVEWAGQVLGGHSAVTLRAVGMAYGSQSSVVDDVIDDRLVLTAGVLSSTDPALPRAAVDAVAATEDAVGALRSLAANLVSAGGGREALVDGARDRAAEVAYAALDGPFRLWLTTLAPGTDVDEARARWHREARRVLHRIGRDLVADAPPTSWSGRDVNGRRVTAPEADGWFQSALARALPLPEASPPDGSLRASETKEATR